MSRKIRVTIPHRLNISIDTRVLVLVIAFFVITVLGCLSAYSDLKRESNRYSDGLTRISEDIQPLKTSFNDALAKTILIKDAYDQGGIAKASELFNDSMDDYDKADTHYKNIIQILEELNIKKFPASPVVRTD